MGCKLLIEAPVNGGRNYNGPKVAKFLVGKFRPHEWRNDGHTVSPRLSEVEMFVKMQSPAARRKDPVNLYCSFALDF